MTSLTQHRPTPVLARARTVLPATTMLIAMALSTLPTPLYPRYAATLDLGPFGITGVFAAFAAGAVGGLLLVERSAAVSAHRMIVTAGASAVLAALMLAADGPLPLFAAARVLSGLGAGAGAAVASAVVLSAATALAPLERRVWTRVAPGLSMLGLSAGPLVAGGLTGAAHWSLTGTYLLIAAVAVLATTGLLVCREEAPDPAAALDTTAAPKSAVALDPAVALSTRATAPTVVDRRVRWTAFAAFATTGVFGALTPTLLHSVVAAPSTLLLGCCASIPFAAGAVGALVRIRPGVGTLCVGAGLTGLVAAVASASLTGFLVASLLAGTGAGTLFRVALTDALRAAAPHDRRRTSAVVLRWAYTGLSVPVLGLGLAVDRLGATSALAGFTVALLLLIAAAVLSPRPQARVRARVRARRIVETHSGRVGS
jgi:MFS family permease